MITAEAESATVSAAGAEPKGRKKARVGTQRAHVAPKKGKVARKTGPAKKAPKGAKKAGTARADSKKAAIIEMLRRKDGANLADIMKATGWQAHSVRGFISGALIKKAGLKVESFKREAGERAYAIRG
jgi:hypothetical protein